MFVDLGMTRNNKERSLLGELTRNKIFAFRSLDQPVPHFANK